MIARIIEYSDLFPEEEQIPDIRNLISHINREKLVYLTTNMMNRLVEKPFLDSSFKASTPNDVDYIRFFLSKDNTQFIEDVVRRYENFEERMKNLGYNEPIYSTRPSAILLFLRYCFSVPPCKDKFNSQMEINFFKALLLANQEVNKAKFSNFIDEDSELQLAKTLMAYSYSNEGIENKDYYDVFRRQLIRFYELFRFLTWNKRFKSLRRAFCDEYQIKNIANYLAPHLIVLKLINLKSGIIEIKKRKGFSKIAHQIMCQSSININEEIPFDRNEDYSYFRGKPFIRLNKNEFAVVSIPFLLEHIYESFYFELKKHRCVIGYKNDDSFRNFITTDFTQNWMLNGFMNVCKSSFQSISLTEIESNSIISNKKELKNVHPLDYYIREGNNVVFFELKSTLASAKTKEKRDLDKFLSDLRKKFFESEGKAKAIKQLMANVKAIQNGSFIFDSRADKNAFIYPVIVVDSTYYTMRGVSVQLETLMREYCKIEKIDDTRIKPIILMDISTLKLYSSLFRKKGFVEVFEEYYSRINAGRNWEEIIFNKQMSFSEYLSREPIEDIEAIFANITKGLIKHMRHR